VVVVISDPLAVQMEITDALLVSSVVRVDLSDNNMTGNRGRETRGLVYFADKYMHGGEAFQCRHSNLTSQGFRCLSKALGVHSTLTFLDVSDNFGGLDPDGRPSSDGITALCEALARSLHFKTLKIGHNVLRDRELEQICESLQMIPTFRDLFIDGNQCRHIGMRALREAIIGHALITDDR
jgi:hypothetical protein